MASSTISRLFALEFLVCLLVIFVAEIVTSVQPEKCFPQVDKVKYWAQVGDRFEVNCTLINCDSKFETQIWERNGRRVRNYRSNLAFFSESKRLKLLIDPVEESDKGEYICHTQIQGLHKRVELIIGVEPTTPTTTTTTTTPTPMTTRITTTTSTSTSTTTLSSTMSKSTSFSSTATATLKVTKTPVKIIKTTKMPLTFTNKTTSRSGANHSRQSLNILSMWTSLLLVFIQAFMR